MGSKIATKLKLVEQAVLKRIQYYQVIVSNDNVKSSKADVLSVSPSSERTGNCAKAVASSRRRAEKKKYKHASPSSSPYACLSSPEGSKRSKPCSAD